MLLATRTSLSSIGLDDKSCDSLDQAFARFDEGRRRIELYLGDLNPIFGSFVCENDRDDIIGFIASLVSFVSAGGDSYFDIYRVDLSWEWHVSFIRGRVQVLVFDPYLD
jgi:hypothetical protein